MCNSEQFVNDKVVEEIAYTVDSNIPKVLHIKFVNWIKDRYKVDDGYNINVEIHEWITDSDTRRKTIINVSRYLSLNEVVSRSKFVCGSPFRDTENLENKEAYYSYFHERR